MRLLSIFVNNVSKSFWSSFGMSREGSLSNMKAFGVARLTARTGTWLIQICSTLHCFHSSKVCTALLQTTFAAGMYRYWRLESNFLIEDRRFSLTKRSIFFCFIDSFFIIFCEFIKLHSHGLSLFIWKFLIKNWKKNQYVNSVL